MDADSRFTTEHGTDRRQYLAFRLGDSEYAVDIASVFEIRCLSAITPIPNTPRYVKGLMNLRGTIIPVVDLRTRLGLPEAPYGPFTVVIVMKNGTRVVGLIVDAVSDVVTVAESAVHSPPELEARGEARFVNGIIDHGGALIACIDMPEVLQSDALIPQAP